jgi:hypothetical protein
MLRAVLAVLCCFAVPANAADLPKGMSLVSGHTLYFVTRDAFVRELPDNNATRIGQIMKGQRITVAGKVVIPKSKGPNWLALKRPDGTIGYVFGAALQPMLDGTLKAPLHGKLSTPERPNCRYIVAFEGRTHVADDIQQTADYDVAFECDGKDADSPLTFNAGMFITELPFEESRESFQINIDLWDVRVNEEDVLSVTALYDLNANRVSFDRVNSDKLGNGKGISPEAATDVPSALSGAIKIAHKVWQPGAWEQLALTPRGEADAESDPNKQSPEDKKPNFESPL